MSAHLRRRGGQPPPPPAQTAQVAIQTPEDLLEATKDGRKPQLQRKGVETHGEVVEEVTRTRKRRNIFIFLLGSLCGIVAAGFFASSTDLIEFPELGELSMDTLLDVLPAGMVRDYKDLIVCCARFPICPYGSLTMRNVVLAR